MLDIPGSLVPAEPNGPALFWAGRSLLDRPLLEVVAQRRRLNPKGTRMNDRLDRLPDERDRMANEGGATEPAVQNKPGADNEAGFIEPISGPVHETLKIEDSFL
jgi:hypothetical protein